MTAEKLPLFALAGAVCAITIAVQWRKAVAPLEILPLDARIGNALVSYAAYALKTIWPARLAVYYPHPVNTLPLSHAAAAGALLLGMSALVIALRHRRPYLAVGWFWYLGALVPVIGLIQVGQQAMADRYTYIPLIGLFIMAAWTLADLEVRWRVPKIAAAALAAIVIGAFAIVAARQTAYWRDSVSLFAHAVRVTDDNTPAYNSLGFALAEQGRADEAENAYRQALAIEPRYPKALANLGALMAERGAFAEAETYLRKAVAGDPTDAIAHCSLALMLAATGRRDEAISEYRETVRLDPDSTQAHNNLGNLLAASGRLDEAIGSLQAALRVDPRYLKAHVNLGNVFTLEKRFAEAAACYEEALRIEPNCLSARVNLGNVLSETGRPDEAAVHFARALELDPSSADARKGLDRATAQRR